MKKATKSHIYDLGTYKFSESDDVDLLQYFIMTSERFEDSNGFRKSSRATEFKLNRRSTVPEVYESALKPITYAERLDYPSQCTEKFLNGLKKTIEQVNQKLSSLSGLAGFVIDTKDFEVIEYAKIRTVYDKIPLYFPVDVKKCVKVGEAEYEVSINFDNPTSLDVGNQTNGCQGSHFGYTIIRTSNGHRTRGHILITTFIGFPSRNQKEKSKVMKEISENPESSKRLVSFTQLCDTAMNDVTLHCNITTDKGIRTDDQNEIYHSDRMKLLPNELKVLQNTFYETVFIFPICCLFASSPSIRKNRICPSCKQLNIKQSNC